MKARTVAIVAAGVVLYTVLLLNFSDPIKQRLSGVSSIFSGGSGGTETAQSRFHLEARTPVKRCIGHIRLLNQLGPLGGATTGCECIAVEADQTLEQGDRDFLSCAVNADEGTANSCWSQYVGGDLGASARQSKFNDKINQACPQFAELTPNTPFIDFPGANSSIGFSANCELPTGVKDKSTTYLVQDPLTRDYIETVGPGGYVRDEKTQQFRWQGCSTG